LGLVPDTLPIAELESYFRGRIRSANSVVNTARVVAGLRKTQLVSSQAALLLGDGVVGNPNIEDYREQPQAGRNRRVVIGEDRVCGVCHKRLGGSVVAVLPDNSVAHYGCLGRAGQGGLKDGGPAARKSSWGWTGKSS
jgi:Vam6/Vps39-like protein vacuolar protein sorting-associated protein 39